ncbi:MAG: single-stranded-DNA-specific exonuclease RecJ [Saprospiraceae bacterium]|nr:MAG: single-stranded-DNA-specific exonuclease RecJ [Saprospiraceae bacterium]
MRKRWTLIPADEHLVNQLQKALRIHPALCRVLVQRGITDYDLAYQFFRPRLDDLHNPFQMKDMDRAVARLRKALNEGEKILLYGDYDVDGTTCVALLYEFLTGLGAHVDYYLPDRHKEGYGVSLEGVDYARHNGVGLVIAMDCGIQAHEAIRQAAAHGIDFIVCDHHLPGTELPPALAILDPKQPACAYPFKELSGCGVVFKFVQALSSELGLPMERCEALLDLVVLSIAADIVPIVGENRILAYYGLRRLNRTDRPGLAALIEKSGRQRPLDINDIVFGLAPMINAAGRLADARQAVQLMLATDKGVAADYARLLHSRNELRKNWNRTIVDEAVQMVEASDADSQRHSIVLFNPAWHKGIVGIAASRLVELYCRPTILLCESQGYAVGSARSVKGFNIHQALEACADLLVSFGGHDHAAGLTLEVGAVPEFQRRFEEVVSKTIDPASLIPEVLVNSRLDLRDITLGFWRVLKQFGPFGPENRRPVFATLHVRDTGNSRLLKGDHLRLWVRQGDGPIWQGMAFGMGAYFETIRKKTSFHIAYNIEEDSWRDQRTLRLLIKDIYVGDRNANEK